MGLRLFTGEDNAVHDPRESYVGASAGQSSIAAMPVDDVLLFLDKLQAEPAADPRGGRY